MLDQGTKDQQIDEILEGTWGLLDVMGILQHHDAVSGTAKQAVADDYAWRLFVGVENNNEQYFDVLTERVSAMTGGASPSDGWYQCFRTNSTYLDCPVASMFNGSMNVAVQNPSTVDMLAVQFSMPKGTYKV